MTDYEPGTVAVATVRGVPNVRVMLGGGRGASGREQVPFWITGTYLPGGEEDGFRVHRDSDVTDIRPLVVLDPDDAGDVSDLVCAWEAATHSSLNHVPLTVAELRMREALLTLTRPPKPAEPSDPTARVTDRRDNIWRLLADGDWVCTSGPDIGEYLAWPRLADERGPLTVEVAR